ncbi:MAG: nucleoside triphosphate pyrophosphohydrolase [Erysipelotrichaceae bacterium]|nr:nucleoside triphosphate pyrophosphohydrolase [Erysipelotrichaceae bacterium]
MERVYQKLVRDNIPDIISKKGEIPIIRILNDTEYQEALEKKLSEELEEVLESSGQERLLELADMLEVISSLATLEGSNLDEVIALASKKAKERGAFKDKIFLEKVIEK